QVRVPQVARVAAGPRDQLRLLRVATGERHLVPALGEQLRERAPPRPATDDHRPHAHPWAAPSSAGASPAPRPAAQVSEVAAGPLTVSGASHEIDRHGYSLHPKAVAEPVLDPVGVVAG